MNVGPTRLRAPVMTAAGTGGHGAELAAYGPLSRLGAVVAKSVGPRPWPGNPPLRVTPSPAGMVNSVGLQGPGVDRWLEEHLPALLREGATVVASIWAEDPDGFAEVAGKLAGSGVTAVEANLSCPNHRAGERLFAHSPSLAKAAVAAACSAGLPVWAKLAASVPAIVEVAAAVAEAGAVAVTLINTLPAMVIDVDRRRPALGGVTGGLSGAAIRPVAVRAVWDCHAALPDLPIVGVGGVATGRDAVEMIMAGASAVQVGTATFADPRAPWNVLGELERWCRSKGVAKICDLVGVAHGEARDG